MLAADEHHWWYRGRRRIVRAQLERLDLPPEAKILDAGCGSGRMLDELAGFGQAIGVDLDGDSVKRARARGHAAVHASLLDMPFDDGTFDLVVCLDVLEHLADDSAALRELLRVTTPGGALLATVPAYQSLWSAHDEANMHHRRYRAPTLLRAAANAGWLPEDFTYFNSVLLAPAAAMRVAMRRRGSRRAPERSDLHLTPTGLDPVLELPLRLEAGLIGRGAHLPAGLSLLAVARRARGDGHGDGDGAVPRSGNGHSRSP